jgi:hypothetical protein
VVNQHGASRVVRIPEFEAVALGPLDREPDGRNLGKLSNWLLLTPVRN